MAQTGYREAETESVLQLSGREVGAAVRADREYFRDSGLTQTGKTGVEIVDVEEFDGNFRILVSVDVSDISYTRGGQRVVSNVANPIFDATMEVRAVEGCLFVQDLKPRV